MTSEEYFKLFKDNALLVREQILKRFASEYAKTCLEINKKGKFSVKMEVYFVSELLSLSLSKIKEHSFIRKLSYTEHPIMYALINNCIPFDYNYLKEILKEINMTEDLITFKANNGLEITSRVDNFESIMCEILKPTIVPKYNIELINCMSEAKKVYDFIYQNKMKNLDAYLKETTAYFADYIENGPEEFLNNLNYYTLKQINRPKEEKIALCAYKKKIVYIYAMNYNPVPLILDDLIKVLEERGIEVTKKNNKLIVSRGIKRKVLK